MASENRRNMNTAMNQMIGQGYNNAFGQAQQAQQFGANLGLQGQQAQLGALQGQLGSANQLAGLGGQQLQAQQGIYNLQNQLGAQQQGQQQNMINQAVQNYATAQQYPFMQLGILNSMLRGLPMQQSSTQMYQAPPSTLAQLGSLGSIGLGAYGAMNPQTPSAKEGGLLSIKRMAAGGNAIPMKSYSDQQLNNVVRSPVSSLMADIYARSLLKDHAYLKSNPMAANLISQQQMPQALPPPEMMANAAPMRTGLDNIGTGEMTQMAGGGLLAFADEGIVPTPDTTFIPRKKSGEVDLNEMYARNIIEGANMGVDKGAQKEMDALRAQITQRDKDKWNYGLMKGGFKGLQNTSPYAAVGLGALGEGVLDYVGKEDTESAADRRKLLEQRVEGTKADQARNIQERTSLTSAIAAEQAKAVTLLSIQATRDATKLAQLATNQQNAAKIYADTLTKNTLALRKYYSDIGLPADENEIQLDAERTTYAAFKNAPKGSVMSDYMAGVAAPEARKPKEVETKPKNTSIFDGLGGKIVDTLRDATGTNKTVPFGQLPK